MATSTLNPGLANDLVQRVAKVVRKLHSNSGQIAVLTAVGMLQMRRAVSNAKWAVPISEVKALTNLSESTVRRHLRYWESYGVLASEDLTLGKAYRVVLPE